jgi:hypothetical protein
MPSARGGHKIKSAKAQTDAPTGSATPKSSRWKTGLLKPTLLSRNTSEPRLAGIVRDQVLPVLESSYSGTSVSQTTQHEVPISVTDAEGTIHFPCETAPVIPIVPEASINPAFSTCDSLASEVNDAHTMQQTELETQGPPRLSDDSMSPPAIQEETPGVSLDAVDDLVNDDTQSIASSSYSRDRLSIYSSDSSSVYSSASSIYSSGASIYSLDEDCESGLDPRTSGRLQYPQRTLPRTVAVRRQEAQDAASRERSTLAKKAAMFKNSRLPPQLPSFNAPLPVWSMVCRAAQASDDCYDSGASTRRGTYTPANTSKDIKAMIVDDQLVDNTRLIIVAIRGTQFQCLSDWSVNKAADPTKPIGFLDDADNACHSGFLQVTKAMVSQVVTQLQQHPALSEQPSLLFTGHSAGGAVASMLYSHMLSASVTSDLTTLANQFSSINCVTFGAPPLSLTPLPKREYGSGVFLSFTNEGDPVTRLSNGAYVKSLVRLLTASTPSNATIAPPVKVVRGSRGTRVIRTTLPTAPVTPWEELPLWPTPPAPLTNAGDVILLRDTESGNASASQVTSEELSDVIFADLAQHTMGMYMRRVKDVAFAAMMGVNV